MKRNFIFIIGIIFLAVSCAQIDNKDEQTIAPIPATNEDSVKILNEINGSIDYLNGTNLSTLPSIVSKQVIQKSAIVENQTYIINSPYGGSISYTYENLDATTDISSSLMNMTFTGKVKVICNGYIIKYNDKEIKIDGTYTCTCDGSYKFNLGTYDTTFNGTGNYNGNLTITGEYTGNYVFNHDIKNNMIGGCDAGKKNMILNLTQDFNGVINNQNFNYSLKYTVSYGL